MAATPRGHMRNAAHRRRGHQRGLDAMPHFLGGLEDILETTAELSSGSFLCRQADLGRGCDDAYNMRPRARLVFQRVSVACSSK